MWSEIVYPNNEISFGEFFDFILQPNAPITGVGNLKKDNSNSINHTEKLQTAFIAPRASVEKVHFSDIDIKQTESAKPATIAYSNNHNLEANSCNQRKRSVTYL